MSDFRFGHIGTGAVSYGHGRQVGDSPDAVIAAICDPSKEAQDKFVEIVGDAAKAATRYANLEKMLASEELDAAVIATPHTQHVGQIRTCLQAGLHVLVEKPMATTAKDARDLTQEAEEAGKLLAIGYQRHGEGRFIKARELVQGGEIGEVRLIHVLMAQDILPLFRPGASWRADPELSGGGHFMDSGSHINDMILWISGLEPQRVHAFINQEGTLVDVNTSLTVEFTTGAVGTMSYTSMSPEWREEFRFYGTEGMLQVGAAEPLLLHRRDADIVLPRDAPRGQPPAANFLDAMRGKAAIQAPPICGLRVAQLSEAAYASAKSGRPEQVG